MKPITKLPKPKLMDHQAREIERAKLHMQGISTAPCSMPNSQQQQFTQNFMAGLQELNEQEQSGHAPNLMDTVFTILKHIKPHVKSITMTKKKST